MDEDDDDGPADDGLADDAPVDDGDDRDDDEGPVEGDDDAPVQDAGNKGVVDAAPPRADSARPTTAGPDAGAAKPSADAEVDSATAPVDAAVAPATGAAAPTKLTVTVKTVTMRGRYAPDHVLAIRITDAQGKFGKTLARHARICARHLTAWNSASAANVVDAVSSATLSSHAVHTVSWNLTNVSKMAVADGDYKVVMEMTENNTSGVTTSIPFTKGPGGVKLMAPDTANFTGMSSVLE